MGKVKAKSTTTTGSNVPVYQFPIGKVKVGRRLKRCARSLYVSIPYGKGKANKSHILTLSCLVSIPYGKGKERTLYESVCRAFVSIPYGKGKDISGRTVHTVKNKYQFPMGKVKQQRHTVNVFL